MITVRFIKDFADKKKGDLFECDNPLASHLIRIDEVAELYENENKEDLNKSSESIIKPKPKKNK